MKHKLYSSTVTALRQAQNGYSWRECAKRLGYPPSYAASLHHAARGQTGAMTLETENILRERLGLPLRIRRRYHRPCMDDATFALWQEFKAAHAAQGA